MNDIIKERAWLVKDLAEIGNVSERTIQRKIQDLKLEAKGLAERQHLSSVSGSKETIIISNEGAKQILKALKPKPKGDLTVYDLFRNMIDTLEAQEKKLRKLENRMDRAPITNKEQGVLTKLKNKVVSYKGVTHRAVWSSFKREFNLAKYNHLEGRKFVEAVNWFNRLLPKNEQHIMVIDILPDDPRQLAFEDE